MAIACNLCGADAVVHWQRRPTADEFSALLASEQAWRDGITALADPASPPVFPPLPIATDYTIPVYACGNHPITLDLASHIHESTCTAPSTANLPSCDCSPESLPVPAAGDDGTSVLPVSWQ